MWPDAQLRAKLLHDIGKAAMRHSEWRYTQVDTLPEEVSGQMELDEGEAPIVSCVVSSDQWYVMTTRRVHVRSHEAPTLHQASNITSYEAGIFKRVPGLLRGNIGDPDLERMTLVLEGGEAVSFAYETGYASMAPIYYLRFWTLKFRGLYPELLVNHANGGS